MTLSKIIPSTGIKVAFIDNDGKKVGGLTVEQANQVAQLNPQTKFYFQNGDGLEEELTIAQVNQLLPTNLLPTAPECPTSPQVCGPPLVKFFGGGGTGASANSIISPISSSIIGFDIIDNGFGFFNSPSAELIDPCGKGNGSKLKVNMEDDEEDTGNYNDYANQFTNAEPQSECNADSNQFAKDTIKNIKRSQKIKNITIVAPGDGYIPSPDGSLGGNERVWKEPDEGFVQTKCGGYYVVQPYRPIEVKQGDTYYPPDGPPRVIEQDEIITLPLVPVNPPIPETIGPTYPVILIIDEIVVLDPGFGYRPGDQLIIDPDKGASANLIINDQGKIERVDVISPGAGFLDLPSLKTNSPTGFNATFSTILKPIRIDITRPIDEQLGQVVPGPIEIVSVIDCVGKIPPKTQFDIVPR
jgi:hypothetical protein